MTDASKPGPKPRRTASRAATGSTKAAASKAAASKPAAAAAAEPKPATKSVPAKSVATKAAAAKPKAAARPKGTTKATTKAAAGPKATTKATRDAAPKPTPKPAAARNAATPTAAARAALPTGLTILFIRHADAGDSAAWTGDDAERPLSKKGRKQSKRLGDLLDRLRVRPEALLASPRVRAADTARLIGRRIGREAKIEARLDAGFNAEALASLVAELDPTASMLAIVGHDPDFSIVASWLAGAPLALSKGALARIDVPERAVGPGIGKLEWLVPPDAVAS